MALIMPNGPDWGFCAHNFPAGISLGSIGTLVTAGASNADGTAVTLLSSLSRDVEYLRLFISGPGASAQDTTCLVSILIDPAGGTSWSTLIAYLCTGFRVTLNVANQRQHGAEYHFPIWIPAGASIGAFARTANASTQNLRVLAIAQGGNANPASWWCGQRVSTIGAVQASSRGTAITPGSTSAFGSWTNIGSTLDNDCGAVQIGTSGPTAGVVAVVLDHLIELGVGSVSIGSPLWYFIHASDIGFQIGTGLIFKNLAAGTQLQARVAGDDDQTVVDIGIAAYAVH
jgi:hypothetical protein